jgi:hypothetical protein
MLDSLFNLLAQTVPAPAEPPFATHILAVIGLGCGLVLWLVGQRVLKPVFGVLGALAGGLVGFLVLPNVASETIAGFPSPYVGLAIGGVFGLGAGLLLFNFALAISTALALGLAGLLVGAAVVKFQPMQDAPNTLSTLRSQAAESVQANDPGTGTRRERVIATAKPLAQTVREFADTRVEEVQSAWSRMTPKDQVILALCGVGGTAAGFFVGLFFPKKSAAVATSLFGSAVWLPSLVWVVHALNVPGVEHIDGRGTVFWLVTWGVIALIGMIVQFGSERRKGPKAEK